MMKILLPLIPLVVLSACAQRNIDTATVTTTPVNTAQLAAAQPLYDVNGNLTQPNTSVVPTRDASGKIDVAGVDPNASFQPNYDGSIQEDPNRIVLSNFSQEQQQRDREAFAARMAEIAAQRQEITTATVPDVPSVNVAAYARSTTNVLGKRAYQRSGSRGSCSYPSSADAQRAFLSAGGPASDPKGLDPDGDGFACKFDPSIYRQIH